MHILSSGCVSPSIGIFLYRWNLSLRKDFLTGRASISNNQNLSLTHQLCYVYLYVYMCILTHQEFNVYIIYMYVCDVFTPSLQYQLPIKYIYRRYTCMYRVLYTMEHIFNRDKIGPGFSLIGTKLGQINKCRNTYVGHNWARCISNRDTIRPD